MDRASPRRRRPFGVMLLTLLWLVYATLAGLFLIDPDLPGSGIARLFEWAGLRPVVHAALVALALASAIGLWFLRPWGWIAAMLLAGVNLAVEIVLYFVGTPNYAYLAVAVVIAFYLNLGEVRGRFFADLEGTAPQRIAGDERVDA
jgi:hypothetical protein